MSIAPTRRPCSPLLTVAVVLLALVALNPFPALADEVEHPIMKPEKVTENSSCANCGMDRNMWARTRYSFFDSKDTYYTCSINCVAVISAKNNEDPQGVMVALYLEPARVIPAEEAYFVVGSSAPGTMTANSKLAFASEADAAAFAEKKGGKVMRFPEALAIAKQELTGKDSQHGMKEMRHDDTKTAPMPHGQMH
ncbi:MAG: nitrous oxide reductase accessory protein NosL [Thermodesulfobacteriota bacterium]